MWDAPDANKFKIHAKSPIHCLFDTSRVYTIVKITLKQNYIQNRAENCDKQFWQTSIFYLLLLYGIIFEDKVVSKA